MADRSVKCSVVNKTGASLELAGVSVIHGIVTVQPPSLIGDGETGEWSAESDGYMAGTEGTATYKVQADGSAVGLYWNNSYLGAKNYATVLAPESPPSTVKLAPPTADQEDQGTVAFALAIGPPVAPDAPVAGEPAPTDPPDVAIVHAQPDRPNHASDPGSPDSAPSPFRCVLADGDAGPPDPDAGSEPTTPPAQPQDVQDDPK